MHTLAVHRSVMVMSRSFRLCFCVLRSFLLCGVGAAVMRIQSCQHMELLVLIGLRYTMLFLSTVTGGAVTIMLGALSQLFGVQWISILIELGVFCGGSQLLATQLQLRVIFYLQACYTSSPFSAFLRRLLICMHHQHLAAEFRNNCLTGAVIVMLAPQLVAVLLKQRVRAQGQQSAALADVLSGFVWLWICVIYVTMPWVSRMIERLCQHYESHLQHMSEQYAGVLQQRYNALREVQAELEDSEGHELRAQAWMLRLYAPWSRSARVHVLHMPHMHGQWQQDALLPV